jgi:hypothetical protein
VKLRQGKVAAEVFAVECQAAYLWVPSDNSLPKEKYPASTENLYKGGYGLWPLQLA